MGVGAGLGGRSVLNVHGEASGKLHDLTPKNCRQITKWLCWKSLYKNMSDLSMMTTPWFDEILICKTNAALWNGVQMRFHEGFFPILGATPQVLKDYCCLLPLISQNNNDCGVFPPITSHNRSVSDIFLDSHKPPTTHIKFTTIVII